MAALAGIRVLDVSRVLAGPFCAMQLADLGAEVIKLEPPEGDDTRALGPPFRDGLSAYFACCNRGKRSIALDLTDPATRPVLDALLGWADVLVENFRTGVAEKLGLGFAQAQAINPRLVHCSISGYGRDGPDANRPGYDYVVQAEAGLMAITGPAEGAASKVGVAVADLFAGQNATVAILAALLQRERTGRGQRIDVSLFDSQLQMLANVASSTLFSGEDAARYGNAHASIVPYQSFRARDGELVIAVASQRLWLDFCRALGREDWIADVRFARNPERVRHRDALVAQIESELERGDVAHWLALLQAAGVPCAPVNGVQAALNHPVAQARGMRVEIAGVPMVGSPLRLSDSPLDYRLPPPRLDAHHEDILRELGLSEPTPAQAETE